MNATFLTSLEGGLLLATVGCYLVAMTVLWAQLCLRRTKSLEHPEGAHRLHLPHSFGIGLLFVGALLHLLALLGEGRVIFSDRAGVASLFGWVLVVVYLAVGRRLSGVSMGAFVTPVALLGALYAIAARPLHLNTSPQWLETQWLIFHVVIMLTGYVALALAFAASLIYLLQDGLLKRKKLTGLWQRLPSLQVADEWIYHATGFGLAMLTLGIVTSVLWQQLAFPSYAVLHDPKVLLSLATWLTFAMYVGARSWLDWSGRRSSLLVVCGFLLMLVSFLGAPHLLPGPH